MVIVENLSVSYKQKHDQVEALRQVSFKIARASTCAIIGPSGSGKSTLLYVLAGIKEDFKGSVLIDGYHVKPGRRKTALILQAYGLLPWKKVWANAALGLEIRQTADKEKQRITKEILEELGLWDLRNRYPSQLSGGQRQRVAIARALALDPDLLLMDEPFSSLDALTREALQQQVLDIWLKNNMTFVLVTHSIEEAIFLGQKIIVLSAHPGQVLDIVNNPRAGDIDYRKTRDFYEMATKLREILNSENKQK